MSYFIVDTWNGHGYTKSGIINHKDNLKDAIDVAYKEFCDRYLCQPDDFRVDNKLQYGDVDGVRYIGYQCMYPGDEDAGAIHIIESKKDTYGIVLYTDINEVKPLTKEDFDKIISDLNEDGEFNRGLEMEKITMTDWILELGSSGSNDAHTDKGFIILCKTAK